MSEDALIRRENLKGLRQTAKQLSERVGGRESYWFGMLGGGRPFGEKIARKIEEAYGLPRGFLDQPRPRGTHTELMESRPTYLATAALPALAPPGALSKRATILAMMFDEIEGEPEKARVYTLCQQIMLGYDPVERPPDRDVPEPGAAPTAGDLAHTTRQVDHSGPRPIQAVFFFWHIPPRIPRTTIYHEIVTKKTDISTISGRKGYKLRALKGAARCFP